MKDKIERCLEEGQKGDRHKGIRKVRPNQNRAEEHLCKAVHNFEAIDFFKQGNFSDWCAPAGFYALYHLLLAILAKKGYESRNQSCTFALLEKMISSGEFIIAQSELKAIFDQDISHDLEHSSKILDIREKYQYSTRMMFEEKEFVEFKARIKTLFDKIRGELERLP